MLATSIFSFSYNFFKRLSSQGLLKSRLFKKAFENIVGKGEIASIAFSPFPTTFSTTLKTNASNLDWCKISYLVE